MNLLTASDLSAMRLTAAEALDSTAVIQTESFVSDGRGGGTAVWSPAGTVACRVAPVIHKGGDEGVEGGRLIGETEVICTFPAETIVGHGARIVCEGQTFSVNSVHERSQELTKRVVARVVE